MLHRKIAVCGKKEKGAVSGVVQGQELLFRHAAYLRDRDAVRTGKIHQLIGRGGKNILSQAAAQQNRLADIDAPAAHNPCQNPAVPGGFQKPAGGVKAFLGLKGCEKGAVAHAALILCGNVLAHGEIKLPAVVDKGDARAACGHGEVLG